MFAMRGTQAQLSSLIQSLTHRLEGYLDLPSWCGPVLATLAGLLVLLLGAVAVYYAARLVLVRGGGALARRTPTQWDNRILARRVYHHLSHLAPGALMLYMASHALPPTSEGLVHALRVLASLYMVFVSLRAINAFLNAAHDIYLMQPTAQERTIKPYVQVAQIVVYMLGGILMVSIALGKNPLNVFLGLGAMAAVLLLVFKDAILGLVASIQASVNHLVKPGDWIVVPSRSADGTVLEITLTTVKVQNWDRTIVTFPTYALISESVTNWKGMSESNGRRIRMSMAVDMRSVHTCTREELAYFRRIALLQDYLSATEAVMAARNEAQGVDMSVGVNGERFTNLGVFRNYVNLYLRHHPSIDSNDTCMARLLPASSKGIPLEVYCFSLVQEWMAYEALQSELMEHLYAILPDFGLRVYQDTSGADVQRALRAALTIHAEPEKS